MTEKKLYVKDPAESAVQLVCALIAAGKIGPGAEEIANAHQAIAKALSKPKSQPLKQ